MCISKQPFQGGLERNLSVTANLTIIWVFLRNKLKTVYFSKYADHVGFYMIPHRADLNL